MKQITILSTVAVALLLAAFVIVRADARGSQRWSGHRWHHFGPVRYLAHELKLSDAQKTRVQALWQAERPIFYAQIRDFLAETKEMNAMAVKDNPDPGEEQKIANREANTIATMLMETGRLQSKVYTTVLNSNQRAKADELQKQWESRLDSLADRLKTQPAEK